ncbi:hypothetical protein BKA83DRAFT_4197121 [Pisolithus microcarpus]|nr:hypothetical protein BKA83DRAFT_4197121 [Pisolithus microcarpus]
MSSATDPESIINTFVDDMRLTFVAIVVNTAFSASLFTLFVVLLALSTKESRRRLVFRLNVLAICLVLTMGILVGFSNGKVILNPFYSLPASVPIAGVFFTFLPPLLCDSILLTRLFALYPPSSTRPAILLKIFAFPFCIKCARVVVLSLLFNNFVRSTTTADGASSSSSFWYRNPYLIAEWTMQMADNMYSVGLFLYNLRVRTGSIKRSGAMSARIRQIFYISAANFVFPLMFNIVLITTVATNQFTVIGGMFSLINNYVTVMGVLCATVWFSRSERVRTPNEPLSDDLFSRNPNFRRVYDTGGTCGSETVVVGNVKRFATPDMADFDAGRVTDCKQATTLTEGDSHSTV